MRLYFNHAMNYSQKSILVNFSCLTRKNRIKNSRGTYIPKNMIVSIDFIDFEMEIADWICKKKKLEIFSIERAKEKSPSKMRSNDFDDFFKNSEKWRNYSKQKFPPLEGIEIRFPVDYLRKIMNINEHQEVKA